MSKIEYKQPKSAVEIAKENFQSKVRDFSKEDLLKMWNNFNISSQNLAFDDLNTMIEEFDIYKIDFIEIVSKELEERFVNEIQLLSEDDLVKKWFKLKGLNIFSDHGLDEAKPEFDGVPLKDCFMLVGKEMFKRGLLSEKEASQYGIV